MKKEGKFNGVKKGIYILPNLVTTASLFCGFYAIIAAINRDFVSSATAVVIACLFDGFDGKIARFTNTTTKFGTEYDSLADLVSFGIAPGILIFLWALSPFGRFGWLASFLYVACCALRLARFNSQDSGTEGRRFKGLPTTGSAAFVATMVLFFFRVGEGQTPSHLGILITAYCLSFLMVSNVKFSNLGSIQLHKKRPFSFLVTVILTLMVVASEPQIVLFILAIIYILSGPVLTIISHKKKEDTDHLIDQNI